MATAGYLGTGHHGLPPWVLAADISQAPQPLSEERQKRRARIGPVVAGMKAGVFNPFHLTDNVADLAEWLKAEGNELFKEKEFFQAYDTYTTGIVILVKRRESNLQILEVLLTNRACSLLKMDFFKACVNDCNMALALNRQNLKAHYRKALALKSIGDYKGARTTAETGQRIALEENRKTDVNEFDELLCEIRCHPDAVALSFKENDVTDIPTNPVLSEERQNWWIYFNSIQKMVWDSATVSKMTAEKLLTLMVGMIKEARMMMEERSYRVAIDLFAGALQMAKYVEVVYLREIDRKLISDVYLQSAVCALKLDDPGRAIEYCDRAVQLNRDNGEALYRKAMALKTKKDFGGALTVALDGCRKAGEKKDSNLVRLCEVLKREIESHLQGVHSEVGSTALGISSPRTTGSKEVDGGSVEKGEFVSQAAAPKKTKKRWKKKAPTDLSEREEKTEDVERDGVDEYCVLYKRDETISDRAVINAISNSDTSILNGNGDLEVDAAKSTNSSEKGDLKKKSDTKVGAVLKPGNSSENGDFYSEGDPSARGDLKGRAVLNAVKISERGDVNEKGDVRVGELLRPIGSSGDRREKGDLGTKGQLSESKPVPQKYAVAQPPACPAPPVSLTQQLPDSTLKSPTLTGSSLDALNQMGNLESVATASRNAQSGALNQNSVRQHLPTAAPRSPVSSANNATVKSATATKSISSSVLNQAASTVAAESTERVETPFTVGLVTVQIKPKKVKSVVDLRPSSPSAVFSPPTKTTDSKSSSFSGTSVLSSGSNQPTKTVDVKPTASQPSPQPAKISASKSATVVAPPSPQAPKQTTSSASNTQQSIPSVVNSATLAPIKPALLPKNLSEFGKPLVSSGTAHSAAQPVRPLLGLDNLSHGSLFQENTNTTNTEESISTTPKKKKKKSKARDASPAGGNASSKPLNPLPPPPFPLRDTCNFRLACVQCFKDNSAPLPVAHKCCEDILIVQNKKSNRWVVVRECNTQVRMGGEYVMCWQIIAGSVCPRGPSCTFAHNTEEMKLWNLQKRGNFRIDEFIANNRSPGNLSTYTVETIYRKYEGDLRMICGSCFREKKLIMTQDLSRTMCNKDAHDLRLSRLLAHRSKEPRVTMIGKRPFPSKKAFYNMCYEKQFCRRRFGCINAHSEIECDIWYVERDTGLKQEQIITEWYKLKDKDKAPIVSSNPSTERPSTPAAPPTNECPYKLTKACDLCFNKGKLVVNETNKERCSSGHVWSINIIYVILPLKKIAKRLPFCIPWNNKFTICRFVNNCYQGNACQFAHSNEEIRLWKWMVANNVKTLEAAMERLPKPAPRLVRTLSSVSLDERRSSTSSSPAWNIPTPAVVSPMVGQEETVYCCYCSLVCNSQAQLEVHCSSSRHVLNVNSDKDRQWNFHQPPWNVWSGNYRLCIHHLGKKCRYSNVPEANNLCTYAHSQEELDEWIERYKWRLMKRNIARDENLFSYMDRILEEYNRSGSSALSDNLNGVRVTCSSQLSLISEDKNAEKTWTFQVESPGLALKKVALLYHESRLHFTLDGFQNRDAQVLSGEDFRAGDQVYNVAVTFRGGLFGSFKQWVVFDFGQRPVLVRKISVDLGHREIQQKVKALRKNLHLDRWTPQNRAIVRYPGNLRAVDDFDEKLVAEYKVPTSAEIMQQVIGHELNQHNYKFKMHSLINLEELTQTRIISGYNVVSKVHVRNCVGDELSGFQFSQGGQLFAQVPLKNQLIEGSLISSSVHSILLAPTDDRTNRVFEAVLAEMDKRALQGSDFIFLSLSPQCCKDLALKHDVEKEMEIQFQINRNLFCQMHYAIDEMQNVDIIFPDIRKIHLTVGEKYKLNSSLTTLYHSKDDYRRPPLSSRLGTGIFKVQTLAEFPDTSKLNDDQKVILNYVSSRRQHFPPPLVVYGPFGTGKTETMAEAAILLTTNNSDVRVLICTKTNQAADEYILRHFEPYVSRSDTPKMSFVRIYHKTRRVNTIDPRARNYSLLSPDGSSFREPTKEDILRNQIVVTTLIASLVITRLRLRGKFTHVFIDEAAQVNECHAVIPLCLANDKTCIVLAGDHIQMADQVYSKEAIDQNFHLSLVERLMSLYDSTLADPTRTPKVLLKANYRNHPEIIKFVAQVFYGGEESLKAKSVQTDLVEFPPLAFYAANGREVQDANSTSYYNEAEIMEVVEQVNRVLERWPKEWGERQADQILVTATYTDQVNRIRSQMRRHRNRELGRVVVLRVQNVPGREFRAVFISTVRTRHLIEQGSSLEDTEDNDYGFLSDCKILNSAFTRAKSFLAVVGDPVALCSIGSCSKIWHQYFKYCDKRPGGINPQQLNLNAIRMQCESFVDALEPPRRHAGTADENEVENPEPFDVKSLLDLEDWNRDYQLEPDDIIRQLVREGLEGPEGAAAGSGFLEDDPIRSENIRVQEREGHILVSYRGSEEQRRNNARLNGENCDDEYDSLSDDDNEGDAVYDSAEPKKLRHLLKSQAEKYKRCRINIDSTKDIFARPLDEPCRYKQIKIATRRQCACAFSGDEVVIEILRADDSNDKERVAFGQVIGILKHAMNPKYRLFVCSVEEGNAGMMIPINKGIPKIYNLEQKNRPKIKPNQVAVYSFLRGGRIQFHRYESVNEFDAVSKLFVVRYLKWDPKFPHPLGIVVQVIPPGVSVDEAMFILNIEHNIPFRFKPETEQEVEALFPAGCTLPSVALVGRVDYRGKVALTIDGSESTDLDDALSFELISSNRYQVVVHISDVSYFLNQATRVDEEARQRGSSFYQAAGAPIHMLPSRLSSGLCSLLPGQDRLTISVFFTINESAEILTVEVKRCVIRSKMRLNYEAVDAIVSGNASELTANISEELEMKLLMLHRIAQKWRQNRLGTMASYHEIEPKWLEGAKAHLLVEEFMVAANHQVATLLLKRFPLETPLRNQLPPNELELEEWRQRFGEEARNTIALTRPFQSKKGEVCRCSGACKCVPKASSVANKELELTKPIVENIKRAFSEGDMDFLRTLVVSPEYHPQLSIALLYLQFLSDKSQYVCSGDVPAEELSHYSLNLSAYTHFTSPIRRYLDVVVHRLLGALIDDRSSWCTQKQMSELCMECTDASRRAAKFEEASRLVHVCQLLKEKPIVVYPVVETIDSNGFRLACPTLRHLLRSKLRVRAAWLQPSDKPTVLPDNRQMQLKWSQRIYDAADRSSERKAHAPKDGELNADKHIVKVNSGLWRKLLEVVMSETEISKIEPKVVAVLQSEKKPPPGVAGFDDEVLTSEGMLVNTGKHFCDFSMQFRESGVVRVQLSVELSRGLLVPNIQLLSLNKSVEICAEHRRDAVACFASTNARKATRPFYGSIYDYQDLWLGVLAIEAASSAVSNDIPATIHSLPIAWHEEGSAGRVSYVGIFKLGEGFCEERYFRFPIGRKEVEEQPDDYYDDEEACSGYFCVRYANVKPHALNTELDLTGVEEVDQPYTWVGHCIMSQKASLDEDKTTVTVKMRLNGNSRLPRELLGQKNFTVEWISKPLPDWRMEVAVNCLDKANKLAQSIALGHNPPSFDKFYLEMVMRWVDRPVPGLCEANITQRNAMRHSMTQPFSLIQGPPGTGKTVVAVQLAYLFRKVNETLPDSFNKKDVRPQVMCCGPSNKSVDVIAGHLMRMKIPETLIIRVYSQKVEKEDFPIPRQLLLIKKKYKLEDKVRDGELKQISLHHMIREDKWNANAEFLRDMDQRIRENQDDVTDEDIQNYRDAIKEAESKLLKLADIILLTCSTSGAPRYKVYGVNVQQLIIDECGMCKEPESLIPIVAFNAKHVVLLGDHQQLQPIVKEMRARKRGLGRSVFERYASTARMLTVQYRMHEAIAEFPSRQFYEGKLTAGKAEQSRPSALPFWPAGGSKPIALVHCVGKEEGLAVDMEEGGVQSKTNAVEIDKAVFVVRQMVEKYGVAAKSIAVLSQYRAQSTHISKKLLNSSTLKEVTAQTVNAAQGSEWDYVVLSTVRSLPEIEIERRPGLPWKRKHLGFVADSHQINVAITRARKGLIIIGNRLLLECDEMWRNLIKHYETEKKIIDAAPFMRDA